MPIHKTDESINTGDENPMRKRGARVSVTQLSCCLYTRFARCAASAAISRALVRSRAGRPSREISRESVSWRPASARLYGTATQASF